MKTTRNASACVGKQPIMVATASTEYSTQLNSTGHVTLMAKRDQKGEKKQQLINIPYL